MALGIERIREEIILWLRRDGVKATSKEGIEYYKIPHKIRAKLILAFVKYLKDLGAEKSEFFLRAKEEIALACTPPKGCIPRKKYNQRILLAKKDVDNARTLIWPPTNEVDPEISKLQKQDMKEMDALRAKVDEEIVNSPEILVEIENDYKYNQSNSLPMPQDFGDEPTTFKKQDRSKLKIEEVENLPDEEMQKLMGYK